MQATRAKKAADFFAHGEKITVPKIIRMWMEERESNRKRKWFVVVQEVTILFTRFISAWNQAGGFTGVSKRRSAATIDSAGSETTRSSRGLSSAAAAGLR